MTDGETWRYEIQGSSLYDLIEARPLSLAEAGEILNAHQRLLITSGVWAAKAGLAEAQLAAARADAEALADVKSFVIDQLNDWRHAEPYQRAFRAVLARLANHESLKSATPTSAGHDRPST